MFVYFVIGGFVAVTFVPAAIRVGWKVLRPKVVGAHGEAKVNRCLGKFKGAGFARFKDLLLPMYGKSAQIDNVLVSRHGIFVIETKNYSGAVRGSCDTAKWQHILPGGKGITREFYNPVWQNNSHIKALRQLLGDLPFRIPFHNIVVFSNNCDVPGLRGVVNMRSLNAELQLQMSGRPVLSNEQVAEIQKHLDKNNIKDKAARVHHVKQAQHTAIASKYRRPEAEQRRIDAECKQAEINIQKMCLDLKIASARAEIGEKNKTMIFNREER